MSVLIDDSDPLVQYNSPRWKLAGKVPEFEATTHSSATPGDTATLTFDETGRRSIITVPEATEILVASLREELKTLDGQSKPSTIAKALFTFQLMPTAVQRKLKIQLQILMSSIGKQSLQIMEQMDRLLLTLGTGDVFAIIIGIDDYITDRYLVQGAVNDARAFLKYLLDPRAERGLEVPPQNIVLLENKNATRDHILSAFRSHLLDNPSIPDNGEATMIFFDSGYGSRITAPGNLMSRDGKVAAISPVDDGTINEAGNYVYPIPDYILGWLFSELSEKGDNITVIFDSSFSGGMGPNVGKAHDVGMPPNVGEAHNVGRPLNVGKAATAFSHAIPLELDDHLWEGRAETAISHRMRSPSENSHVLLAACQEDEMCITLLHRTNLKDTTYVALFNRLPTWSTQTPYLGGANKDRLVFNGDFPATGGGMLPLVLHTSSDPKDPNILQLFRVEMGAVEGVVPGTEFTIHAGDSNFLCTLVAHSVAIHQTLLVTKNKMPISIPEGSRAAVLNWKNDLMVPHIYLPSEYPYTADLFPMTDITHEPHRHKFVQARSPAEADIMVHAEGDEIVIQRLTGTILEYHLVSTQKLDLGWIQQKISPFDPRFEGTDPFKMRREAPADLANLPRWDTLRVVLTMTRG
ncbi:hypothetical protein B0H13DRAFT_2313620 [Mycena leptocephala]|nr:hypothetical protein B0H13DRAFT_2313620 [Mycena leptocephala]